MKVRRSVALGGVGALLVLLAFAASIAWRTRGPDVRLSVARAAQAGPAGVTGARDRAAASIRTMKVERTSIVPDLLVVGSVMAAEDYFAIVGPAIGGRIARIAVRVGDRVTKGQVMAEIESAEVGQARADYISARASWVAAEANRIRQKELADRQISSRRESELADALAASHRARMRAAIERLRAMGLDDLDVRRLQESGGTSSTVAIRASIAGRVLDRMVTLGESIEKYEDAFTIANLDLVWVLLDVHEKDLAQVRVGQPVNVRTEAYPGETFKARVAYVEPVVDHTTRTARVRLEVENRAGKLRLHQFVTARILDSAARYGHAAIAVPKSALARIDGASVVFVKAERGFERRIVEPGPTGGELVEVRSGLNPGEEVAVLAAAAVDELR